MGNKTAWTKLFTLKVDYCNTFKRPWGLTNKEKDGQKGSLASFMWKKVREMYVDSMFNQFLC